MDENEIKFKTRKSWNEFGHSHYLTFSTFEKRPYLESERICRELAKSINIATEKHDFAVMGYVFMPNHVHMLIHPMSESYHMAMILRAIKQRPSQTARAKKWIETNLWMPGGGFDSNITHPKARTEILTYLHQNPVRKNLVESASDFRWSSANWYFTGDQGDVQCMYSGQIWTN